MTTALNGDSAVFEPSNLTAPPAGSCAIPPPASEPAGGRTAGGAGAAGPLEIPYAIRWLVPKGERFANFDILNDNDTQLDYYRRFGHIYAVGIPTKKWRLVVVSDPELLDEVAGDEEQFGKPVEEINFFAQLKHSRGDGLSVIGDGERYERIRRVMLPWYAPSHQRTQLERMKEQARKLVAIWTTIADDEPLDARAWMERYTLEVSGRGACSYNFGLLDGVGTPHPFAAAVPESTKESILRVAEPSPDFTLFAGRARRARKRHYRHQNEELFTTADALVRARMHTCPLGQQTDLLSRLVSVPDPETGECLDTDTVRDQILMHLSNGFNGPSITAAWILYVLATRPDVEEKLIAEIDAVSGGDPDYDLKYEDLMSLTYTTQVIKETLRVYPPMPVTIRRSLKDGTLGGYRVRRGDIILIGTLAAQRDPRYWGPEADRFDPEQFAMEKVVDRPRHAFIPFSIGKRQCMAQELTFMMLRVLLFEICRRYRLRLAPDAMVAKNTVVTTKPAAVPVVRLPRQRRRPGADAGRSARTPRRSGPHDRVRLGQAHGGPADQRLPPSADRVWEQLWIQQGAGGAVCAARPLPRLHERASHAQRTRGVAPGWDRAVAARDHDVHVHVEPTVERDRVQVVARPRRARDGAVAELPLPRLGPRKQPVERVPRLPALRASQALGARRHATHRVRVRRRRLAGLGASAPGVEHAGLAGDAGALGRTGDGGGGRTGRG